MGKVQSNQLCPHFKQLVHVTSRKGVEILKVHVSTNVNSVYDPIHKLLKIVVSTGHQVRPYQGLAAE